MISTNYNNNDIIIIIQCLCRHIIYNNIFRCYCCRHGTDKKGFIILSRVCVNVLTYTSFVKGISEKILYVCLLEKIGKLVAIIIIIY